MIILPVLVTVKFPVPQHVTFPYTITCDVILQLSVAFIAQLPAPEYVHELVVVVQASLTPRVMLIEFNGGALYAEHKVMLIEFNGGAVYELAKVMIAIPINNPIRI